MPTLLYAAAALLGYQALKPKKLHSARVARVATTRLRNCGTNARCNCRSRR